MAGLTTGHQLDKLSDRYAKRKKRKIKLEKAKKRASRGGSIGFAQFEELGGEIVPPP